MKKVPTKAEVKEKSELVDRTPLKDASSIRKEIVEKEKEKGKAKVGGNTSASHGENDAGLCKKKEKKNKRSKRYVSSSSSDDEDVKPKSKVQKTHGSSESKKANIRAVPPVPHDVKARFLHDAKANSEAAAAVVAKIVSKRDAEIGWTDFNTNFM